MASGKLGSVNTTANTAVAVYTVPTGKIATFNICVVNRSTTNAKVRIALSTDATLANDEYIEYDSIIPGSGVLERTAIIASAGEKVYVQADNALCSVRVHGYEEVAA